MTDMCSVKLTFRKKDYEVISDIEAFYEEDVLEYKEKGIDLVRITYEEVNEGILDFEAALNKSLIPYDKESSACNSFPAELNQIRVSLNSELICKTFRVNEYKKLNLESLVSAAADGIEAVNLLIDKTKTKFHVIPWDEQDVILKNRITTSRLSSVS